MLREARAPHFGCISLVSLKVSSDFELPLATPPAFYRENIVVFKKSMTKTFT